IFHYEPPDKHILRVKHNMLTDKPNHRQKIDKSEQSFTNERYLSQKIQNYNLMTSKKMNHPH
ncbi:hypothetical protein Q4R45_20960, partial [Morganella morganii subsp. sibonii]